MARLAIRLTGVVKMGRSPCAGAVAIRTLPCKVVGRPVVTGLAVGEPGMVEIHRSPRVGQVAVGALPWKVIGRSLVARLAVADSCY